jgi:hypothetical protein
VGRAESAVVVHLSPAAVVQCDEYLGHWMQAAPLSRFRHFGARPGAGGPNNKRRLMYCNISLFLIFVIAIIGTDGCDGIDTKERPQGSGEGMGRGRGGGGERGGVLSHFGAYVRQNIR